MEFSSLTARVFDLYGQGRYQEALDAVGSARRSHPEQDGRLTFWEGCLLSVSGRPKEALAVLADGLDRGLFWSPRMLEDHDLDAARGEPGWPDLLRRCEAAAADAMSQRPPVRVRPGLTGEAPVLVTLHGAGADPDIHADHWEAATPDEWTVVSPVGLVPHSTFTWGWPHDAGSAEPAALDQIAGVDMPTAPVLGGFSQGAGVAADIGSRQSIPVAGLVLVAPSFVWSDTADAAARLRVPTYIIVGSEDWGLPQAQELHRLLRDEERPAVLDIREGLGHTLPLDFEETLPRALAWILDASSG